MFYLPILRTVKRIIKKWRRENARKFWECQRNKQNKGESEQTGMIMWTSSGNYQFPDGDLFVCLLILGEGDTHLFKFI